MAFGSWVVGVFLKFSSNGVTTMERLSSSARAANEQLLKQQGLIDANTAAMMRYQRRMEQVRMEQLRVGTIFAGGVAVAGIGSMTLAAKQAADLQTALRTVQIGTGFSDAQMQKVRESAYDISNMTAQSVVQSAKILGVMATSGAFPSNKSGHVQFDPKFAAAVAKFADVQFINRGTGFEDAARQAVQLAHLYQAYTPERITPLLDKMTKLSFMMPDNLNRYLTQAGYYMPLFRRMGVSDDQSLIVGAFLDRMGMGRGKGGTALQDFVIQSMNALQQTAHAQGGHLAALQKLGIVDDHGRNRFYSTDKVGNTTFDLFGELVQINKALEDQTKGLHGSALTAKRADFINDILSAFKIQGGRFGFLATPKGIDQLLGMIRQMGTMPGVNQAQTGDMNTLNAQFFRATSNLRSTLTELGWPWLGELTDLFRTIGDKSHDLQSFLHQHKDIDKSIGGAVAVISTLASVRFGVGIWQLSAAVVGFGKTVDAVKNKILLDEAELDAGSLLGGGGKGKRKGGGILSWLDWVILGGLGKQAFGAGTKVTTFIGKYIATPIEGIGPWIVKLGQKIGLVGAIEESSILGNLGRLVAGIGGIGTLLGGAIGGILRLVTGPWGMLAFMSDDDFHRRPDYKTMDWSIFTGAQSSAPLSSDQIRKRAHQVGWNNLSPDVQQHLRALQAEEKSERTVKLDRIFEKIDSFLTLQAKVKTEKPKVDVNGVQIQFNLPAGTSQDQGHAAAEHFFHLVGAFAPHPEVPNPLTIGGSNLLLGT